MSGYYVVTAHKPTAVTHSCAGYFTSPKELNLIIAKSTRIEIHLVTTDGLQSLLDVPIYGRIATLELFRPNGATQDLLFITTERHECCVLQWDAKAHKLITRSKGDLSGQTGHPTDNGQIGIIDPDCRLIGLHLYDGLFMVIPFDEEGKLKESFSIRLEPQALDMKFLYGCEKPTVVVLYQGNENVRNIKAYEVPLENVPNLPQGEIWALNYLDYGPYLLIPVSLPLCGVLIIGGNVIVYCNASAVTDTCRIRYNLHLLGGQNGGLHLLVIAHDMEKVTGLTINYLGETSIASTISYLRDPDPLVYIGSSYGDSQLVKVTLQPGAESCSFEVRNRYDNLGPIGDFCIVDREGQRLVVTCSGAYKDGSLRVTQNKIGIHEQASTELRGIKGMWSLRSVTDDSYDKFLVVSFTNETRFYQVELDSTSREDFTSLNNFELVEASIRGFNSEVQTLVCHHVICDQFVQVTPNSVRLVNSLTLDMKSEWSAPGPLTVATANATQVLLAFGSGGHKSLLCLTIGDGVLNRMGSVTLRGGVSCLDINPIAEKANSSGFAAVGMWEDRCVSIYSLPKLDFSGKENLGGVDSIPRSVLMCSFDGRSYLFCGLGDGHVVHFELNSITGKLTGKKKVSVGTQPVALHTFLSKEAMRVFAASDTPKIIYSSNKEVLYCDIHNLKDVSQMTPYNVEDFPNSLAIAKEGQLSICSIDEKPKLHIIHSIYLRECALRISHQEQSHTIAVCSVKYEDGDVPITRVRLFDDQKFQRISIYKLDRFEHACSMLSCLFSDDGTAYYCVGTAYVRPNQKECTKGRILLLQVIPDSRKFNLVAQMITGGAVYSLNFFNGYLLAAINENILLFKWDGRSRKLQQECEYHGRILSRFVQTRGDFIIVGDAMRSISLLYLKREEEKNVIEELARDCSINWLSAVEFLSDTIYLGANNSLELFTVAARTTYNQCEILEAEHGTYNQCKILEVNGLFHLGEFVNRFQHSSLATSHQDSEMSFYDSEWCKDFEMSSVIFGTVNGVLGVIASLPPQRYHLLEELQGSLRMMTEGVGELSHTKWRSSRQEHKKWRSKSLELRFVDSKRFVDGDLIESFLNLSTKQMQDIAERMEVRVEKLRKIVLELTNLY